MEIKDLQREIIDAERLAERGKMALDLNQQLVGLKAQLAERDKRIEELTAELAAAKEIRDAD